MSERRRVIHGELARICGWDNAMLSFEIDTSTNKVTFTLQSYMRGVGSRKRKYSSYADAQYAFDRFDRMTHGGTL